jgi:hypothetical protein
MFYIYQHIRNDNNSIFYVGKGTGYRCNQKTGRNIYWKRVVDKCNGYSIEKVVTNLDEELALLVEMELIDKYKKLGYKLTNLSEGGEGSTGYKFTEEQIEKTRLANLGKKHSEETKFKMSIAKKGKPPNNMGKIYTIKEPFTKEHIEKLRESHRGKKQSEETKLKRSLSTKGKPKSEETKMRMKLAQSSPEARALQSERMKMVRKNNNWSTKKMITPPVSPASQPLPWSN